MPEKKDPQQRAWETFVQRLDTAKSANKEVEVLALEGLPVDGKPVGFYKLYVRAAGGRWWAATSSGVRQVDFDPVAYQDRITRQGNALPASHVARGTVRQLLDHRAAKHVPISPVILNVLVELAQRWGNGLDAMGLSITAAAADP